jgi:chemotaxis protein MotA
MDIASIVGLLLACAMMAASILMSPGASFSAFVDYPSIMVVVGGGFAAALICFPLQKFLLLPVIVKKVFRHSVDNLPQLISTIVRLSETARRDGLLALDDKLEEIEHPFIALGLQMAIDGTQADVIEDVLRTEMETLATRNHDAKAVLDQLGRFAPAFGMIGTLLGLVIMLGNMDDPSSIGPGMAVALLTTLYGAVLANIVFLPMSEKLALLNRQESRTREIMLRGILAIQSGDHPRIIEQRLRAYLPSGSPPDLRKEAA